MILDGATNWGGNGPCPAAEGFDIEARSKAIYEWVRQLRGGILAGAFTVERHINGTIAYFMLGDRARIPEVHLVFEEGLLGPMTFERRINVIMLIAPHVLPPDEATSLKADLNQLRTLRNAMAHKPFWLHPELNDKREVINLVPVIQRGKATVPLTTAFVEAVNALIHSLIERTNDLAKRISENAWPA